MISELGLRHIERLRERIASFEEGRLALGVLVADTESLLGLLVDEADADWIADLQAECNRLEFTYASAVEDGRPLSPDEKADVGDAVRQLRLMLARY